MRRAWAWWLVAVAWTALPAPARAADITDVASAFDEGNPFDFRFRVRYDHTEKRARIRREVEVLTPTQASIAMVDDLAYRFSQDALTLRTEFGLFQDLMLYAELPVYLAQGESYAFDGSVTAASSTTVRDMIAPAPMSGTTVFTGASRGAAGGSGLDAFDTINLGLSWAPVSQVRDATKPTWVLTFEPQISFGNIMAYDRAMPNANHAVSEGVHRLIFRTAISRRWQFIEPYMTFWYLYPIARGDSLFKDYGPAQKWKNPMQQGGTTFGAELVPFERVKEGYKLYFDVRGRLEGHFQGRGYSEGWELFAASAPLACDMAQAGFNPACDPAQTTNAYQNQPFTGLTTIQSYATLGVDLAVGAQITKYLRLRATFEYYHDQAHFITGEDIGVPMTSSGRVMSANEFNPAYRAIIDQIGRRFFVDDVNIYNVNVWAQAMF
jgi:hypothetical protein